MKRMQLSLLALGATLFATATAAPPDVQVSPQGKPPFHQKPGHSGLVLNQDLAVTAIGMTPEAPTAGQDVQFEFTITNQGAIKTPEAEVLATFWDTQGGGDWGRFTQSVPKLPPLDPGKSRVLKINTVFITLGDTAGVSVTVDRFNQINETDETNNEKIHTFHVACKPDLSPFDYRKPKPPTPYLDTYPNQELKHTIWVYNNGWCHSKPATLSVGCDDHWPVSVNIPPVNGRQRVGLPVTLTWKTAGVRNCLIQVDSADTNDESIETNNKGDMTVSVISQAWPKP